MVEKSIEKNSLQSFETADITDDLFFCEIMSEKEFALPLLQRIFPELGITSIGQPIKQNVIKNNHNEHGVRFDVYIESLNKHFDIEMQTTDNPYLGKRIRYYQGKLDSSLLKEGGKYSELPPTYIVFICTFDPFDIGSYEYNLYELYDPEKHVKLETEGHVKLLNIFGTDPQNINSKLRSFLDFAAGKESQEDEYLKQIKNKIIKLKQSVEWRLTYMQEYNQIAVKERQEGIKQGVVEVLSALIKKDKAAGLNTADIFKEMKALSSSLTDKELAELIEKS